MSHVIIGTAGHVDHGKTALIKALTGQDTDRLREEKERGISIELGFAPLKLPSGRQAGVVDVPGHERFIHNMLAGIGGIDLVLLVVDVSEGVMPQTREHLEIMDLLQIGSGIVVLTKTDLAEDEDWLDLVEEEVREALSGTFLAEAVCLRVSAQTGRGLAELVATIDKLTGEVSSRDHKAPLRLPVDRVFTVAGFGTIVTGTMLSGTVRPGMAVEILPVGRSVRVRQVQVHGKLLPEAMAGQRVAVNLPGLEKEALLRGSVVALPGSLTATYLLDVSMKLLPSAPKAVKNLTRVHVYLGTGRAVGRIALLDRDELKQGEEAPVQIRLERRLVAQRGDRVIIRSFSPMRTIGGGLVLAVGSEKHKRFKADILAKLKELEKGDPAEPLLQQIRRESVVARSELAKKAGMAPDLLAENLARLVEEGKIIDASGLLLDMSAVYGWEELIVEALENWHQNNHLLPGKSRAELRGALPKSVPQKIYDWLLTNLTEEGRIKTSHDVVALAIHTPEPTEREAVLIQNLAELYREGGFMPPTLQEAAEKSGVSEEQLGSYVAYLIWQGELVRLDNQLALHQLFFRQAKEELLSHFQTKQTLAASEFRVRLGSSRKFVLPLLETFDRLKWTRRQGDERVPWRLELAREEADSGD
ncbi:MAG: Selenocysteine-specific elongation factor [Dehalococcoidia bacterium]|nr:Selenocysteine-specific elongation factor [Bacillota bacterium]